MSDSEHNYVQRMDWVIEGLSGSTTSAVFVPKDYSETVTFHLTLSRGDLESLYWWDMEASDAVCAQIERQLIDQGFMAPAHGMFVKTDEEDDDATGN